MSRSRFVAPAVVLLALAVVPAGCGGSGVADRSKPAGTVPRRAAAFAPSNRTCAPQNPSFTYTAAIVNRLPFPVRLQAGEYDCNDWSGVSTPGRAFTGKIVRPGERLEFVLEPVKYTTRYWTLEVEPAAGGASFGAVRMKLPQTSLDVERVEVLGSERVPVANGSVDDCDVLKLDPTDAPETPKSDWPDYFPHSTPLGIVSYGGRVTVASFCLIHGV